MSKKYAIKYKPKKDKEKLSLALRAFGKKVGFALLFCLLGIILAFELLAYWANDIAMSCTPTYFISEGVHCGDFVVEEVVDDTRAIMSNQNTDDLYIVTFSGDKWLNKPFFIKIFSEPQVNVESVEIYEE